MKVLRTLFLASLFSLALGCQQQIEGSQESLETQAKVGGNRKYEVTDVAVLDPSLSELGRAMPAGANKSVCLIRVKQSIQEEDLGEFYLTTGSYQVTKATVQGTPIAVPVCPYSPGGTYSFSEVETLPVDIEDNTILIKDSRSWKISEQSGVRLKLGQLFLKRGSFETTDQPLWGSQPGTPTAKALRVAYQSITAGTVNGKPKPRYVVKDNRLYWNQGTGTTPVSTFVLCNDQEHCALRAQNGSLYIRKNIGKNNAEQLCYIWEFGKGLGNSVSPSETRNDPRCSD